jgi:glucosamine kinase
VMPPDGAPRIIGGHGFLLGDEGGAFWIGREGLRAVLRAADGRGPSTALAGPASSRFDGLHDLGARLHAADRPVDSIARFAPDVLVEAEAGDAVASALVESAVDELVGLVESASAAVGDESAVPVALGGRLLSEGPLRRRLADALARRVPAADVRTADGSPLDGAMLLGAGEGPGRYAALVHVWDGGVR